MPQRKLESVGVDELQAQLERLAERVQLLEKKQEEREKVDAVILSEVDKAVEEQKKSLRVGEFKKIEELIADSVDRVNNIIDIAAKLAP